MQAYSRAISTPIVSSATFFYENSQEAEDIFSGNSSQFLYSRMGNPTSAQLEEKLSKMENAIGAVTTSSGMGAITMVIMSLCSSGDEIVAVGGLFGGSYALMSQTLPRFGINTKFLGVDDLDSIENSITTKTKVIFCESVGNPSLRLPDLEALGKIATKHNVAFVVDNTITPLVVKPFEHGADIVVYSTTKIVSGNSSGLGGAAIFKEVKNSDKFHTARYEFLKPFINKLQGKALIGCAKKRSLRDFGMSANAHSSYQTILGLETLELRSNRINTSCEIIAQILKSEGLNVNHPSLEDNVDNELYKRSFKDGCGSMLTIDMGTQEKAYKFLDTSKLLTLTANIGDSRTLGLHMASTIYQDFSDNEKEYLGITEGLIRISIGLEKP
ncbi:MAG: aminotransferase class I/II-fold pyridoxal phosphate-dependent enzyme, partial [Arcobacteraceae bacterium]